MRTIEVFKTTEELYMRAAGLFVGITNEAVRKKGWFAVALAGGSTPKGLYRLLASDKFKNQVDWSRGHYFVGDERNVLETSHESNRRMIAEDLIEPLGINSGRLVGWNVYRPDRPDIVVNSMQIALANVFRPSPERLANLPTFDLVLLGLGSDAHTASLFPGTEALKEAEKPAIGNWVEKLNSLRYTLTFPAINNASNVIFLVIGKDKAEAVRNVLEGERQPEKFPAQSVDPENGRLYWLLDADASSLLVEDRFAFPPRET